MTGTKETKAQIGHRATSLQRVAANPDLSVWVSANAGTGKTKVLTDRVLRLLVAGTAPRRILCLTFTKAAAAEMANRLNEKLSQWSVMADGDLNKALFNLLDREAMPGEVIMARQLFAKVLDEPGGLKFQTIHAFCESILSRFPLEAGVSPNMTVIDEREQADLLQEASDEVLLHARSTADDPLHYALKVVSHRADETVFADLINELRGKQRQLRRLLPVGRTVEEAVATIKDALGVGPFDTEETLLEEACQEEAFDGVNLRRAMQALMNEGGKGDKERAACFEPWLALPEERVSRWQSYLTVFFTAEGAIRKRLATKAVEKTCPDVVDILTVEAERLLAVKDRINAAIVAEASEALLIMGSALLARYRAKKAARAALDYDDLIMLTRDLLQMPDLAPWVLFKLDGGIDHILVDEAQDTSPDQWEVVRTIAEEFFVGESAREGLDRTLFVVGDSKQSIYSFQGADPHVFDRMKRHFAVKVQQAGRMWRPVDLEVSFRSTEAVLSIVDDIFAQDGAKDGLVFDDNEIRHMAHRVGDAGVVAVWPLFEPEDKDDEDSWTLPTEQKSAERPLTRLAQTIAATIKDWLDRGEMLAAKGRPIRAGDVMILVQRRGEFQSQMIRALKSLGVPVAGTDRMRLTEQLAVMDLLSLTRFLLLPEDDLSLAEALKSPLFGLDDEDLYGLAYGRAKNVSLWRSLSARAPDNPKWQAVREALDGLLNQVDFVSPYQLFAELLGRKGGRARFLARLGEEANDPLDEFLNQALTFERSRPPSLQTFLHWIESGSTEIKRDLEAGRDEVRVMTVHGSKGLQAPIVFLPDTVRVPQQDDRLLWADDPAGRDQPLMLWPPRSEYMDPLSREARAAARHLREQEYRRLLYVALTRAEDRLYVAGWLGKRKPAEHCWYNLISQALGPHFTEAEVLPDGPVQHYVMAQEEPVNPPPVSEVVQALPAPLPAWASRMAPEEPSPSRPLTPSKPLLEDPPAKSPLAMAEDKLRFKRGRLIHRLLETLPDLPDAGRREAALRFMMAPAHALDLNEAEAVWQEVIAIMGHADFAPLFGPGSKAEVPVAGALGAEVISGRIDRLVVTASSVLIVDYKTNRPPPKEVSHVPKAYLRQMAAYRAALVKIYPEKSVRCALLWTDEARLMPLPESMLDAAFP